MLLVALNQYPMYDRGYSTSIPLASYHLLVAVVSVIVVPLLAGLATWLLVGLAVSFYPDAWKVFQRSARRAWRRDALVALALGIAAHAGFARFDALLANWFHAYAPVSVDLFPGDFNAALPALGFFLSSLLWSLIYTSLVGLAIVAVRVGWKVRAWWLWAAFAVVLVSLGPSQAHSFGTYAIGWVESCLPLLVLVVLIALFLRDNILAYLALSFCSRLVEPLWDSFVQPHSFFRWNGVVLAGLTAAVLAWMFLVSGRGEGVTQPHPSGS